MRKIFKRMAVDMGVAIPYNIIIGLLTDDLITGLVAGVLIVLSVELVIWGLNKDK